MTVRIRAITTAATALTALIALTGCADAGAVPPQTKGPGEPAPSDSAPATGGATTASNVAGMNCANVLADPEPLLVQTSSKIKVLKSQWTVEGGDFKIIPPSALAYSTGGSKSEHGEYEFAIDGGVRCRIRGSQPSGDPGTTFEYVKFESTERDGIVEFLRGNGFAETTLADGTLVFTHTYQNEQGEGVFYRHTWYIGPDWLGVGYFWPEETGDGVSPFVGEFTEASPADYLRPELQSPTCGTFFATFQGDYERLPIGEIFTGFNSMDPESGRDAMVTDEFLPDVEPNACIPLWWTEATPEEIEERIASLGSPAETTAESEIYHDPAMETEDGGAGYVVVFDDGYVETGLSLPLAQKIRPPELTFRSLGDE